MQPLSFALQETWTSGTLLKTTPDLRTFMFESARRRRQKLPVKVAAITGSAGKTTVKEILNHLLKNTIITPGNQNTKLALALQILRLPQNQPHAVFEMGARRVGDFQTPLSYLQPEVVTLLNIGSAHVGEFGSQENLLREKLSPLEFPSVKTLVIPGDDTRIAEHARSQSKNILSFGTDTHDDVELLQETSKDVQLRVFKENIFIKCPFRGPKKGLNIAAAVATALALGAHTQDLIPTLAGFHGVERRFQTFTWCNRLAIDDAFNASPESMREGLHHLRNQSRGENLLLVLGTMLELGEACELEHRKLGQYIGELFNEEIRQNKITLVTIGSEARTISADNVTGINKKHLHHFSSALEAKSTLQSLAQLSNVIYFKASKGIQLNKIFSSNI